MYHFSIEKTDRNNNEEIRVDVLSGFWKHINPSFISHIYGIIVNESNQILLTQNPDSQPWQLPNKPKKEGESPKQTLNSALIEQTQIKEKPKNPKQFLFQKILIKDEETEKYELEKVEVFWLVKTKNYTPANNTEKWVEKDKLPNYLEEKSVAKLIGELLES